MRLSENVCNKRKNQYRGYAWNTSTHDPPVSVPIDTSDDPSATLAADPDELPPDNKT